MESIKDRVTHGVKTKENKAKKQRANKISSLKTMNSRKQRIEKTNSEAIKKYLTSVN